MMSCPESNDFFSKLYSCTGCVMRRRQRRGEWIENKIPLMIGEIIGGKTYAKAGQHRGGWHNYSLVHGQPSGLF